jgi:hypothetical protein
MSVKIDDLILNERTSDDVQGTIKEIRTVRKLNILGRRKLVEQKVAGAYGSTISDVGRRANRILIEGEFMGESATQGITQLRTKYRAGKPMEFVSELSTYAQIPKVLIEELQIVSSSGFQNHYKYRMILREYVEPPPEEQTPPAEESPVETEIDDIRGQVLDEEGNPAAGKKVKISGPDGETEVTTDENGYYELLDVPEGNYVVTSDEEGYEDLRIEFEVRKGQGSGGEEAG